MSYPSAIAHQRSRIEPCQGTGRGIGQLRVADFTDIPTRSQGKASVAFITDVFARKDCRLAVRHLHDHFPGTSDLESGALPVRLPTGETLIHHSDRGSQYPSLRYTEGLIQAGTAISVGSRGDS